METTKEEYVNSSTGEVVEKQDEKGSDSRDTEGDVGETTTTKEEPQQLNPQLLTLMNQARIGDARTLHKMTTAVKRFLYESSLKNEIKRNVNLLLEQEGFMQPLLLKCLRSNVTKIPALVGDSLWILNSIFNSSCTRGKKEQMKNLVELGGAVPLMVKLAGVQDNQYNLNGLAICVLEHFAMHGYRDQIVASSQPLLSALMKVVKKKNCSAELLERMIHIISVLLGQILKVRDLILRQRKKEIPCDQEQQKNLPPLNLAKQAIPLLNVLLNCKNDEVVEKTLSCLAFIGSIKGIFDCMLDSGILKKIPTFFNHSEETLRFFAVTCISSIVSPTDNIITFLKYMKGTHGLKDFYVALNNNKDTTIWAADQFFSAAVNAITTGDCDISVINAVLTSGFAHSLVQCLKPGTPDKYILGSAWALGRISTESGLTQRRYLVEAGALPYLIEHLKNDSEVISSMGAVIMGNMVHEKPLVRDQVVSSGAISLMIDILNREGITLQTYISVLASIEMVADVRPPADPAYLKDVPPTLIRVLQNRSGSIKVPEKLIPGVYSIVSKMCEHGEAGIKLVLDCGFLSRITSGLSCDNADTLVFALESIESIARIGSKEQQNLIMEVTIVERLIELIQHTSKYIRGLALSSLSYIYKGQLTAERRKSLQEMVPKMVVQLQHEDPRTHHPAGLAFRNVISSFKIRI